MNQYSGRPTERLCRQCGQAFMTLPCKLRQGRGVFCNRACWRISKANYIPRISNTERFWSKVNKTEWCWLWTDTPYENGYGYFWVDGKNVRAHKYAWEMENGPVPEGMVICHTCDTPLCVRNDGVDSHLFDGTSQDNSDDKIQKGRARSPTGISHPQAKLTPDAVRDIRASRQDGQQIKVIAQRHGVSSQTISDVLRGKNWSHVV